MHIYIIRSIESKIMINITMKLFIDEYSQSTVTGAYYSKECTTVKQQKISVREIYTGLVQAPPDAQKTDSLSFFRNCLLN